MKSLCSGLLVAFSLYSAIPVPQVRWEKKTMRWALIFLPLIGFVIGLLQWGWLVFCKTFGASELFYAVIAGLLPLILSGGIHLDGFCDTCDALCSFGDREKKLAILKDPHVGAFGPMWLIAFLLAEVACFAQIYHKPVYFPIVIFAFATARAAGGCKIVIPPCAKDSGLAHLFAENSDKKIVASVLILEATVYLICSGILLYAVPNGIRSVKIIIAFLLVWFFLHHRLSKTLFGGITGDLAGFFISTAELLMLAVAALGGLLA